MYDSQGYVMEQTKKHKERAKAARAAKDPKAQPVSTSAQDDTKAPPSAVDEEQGTAEGADDDSNETQIALKQPEAVSLEISS